MTTVPTAAPACPVAGWGQQRDERDQHGTDAEPEDEERRQDQFEQDQRDAEDQPDPPLHFHMGETFRGRGVEFKGGQ
jgi:hypothetical protein